MFLNCKELLHIKDIYKRAWLTANWELMVWHSIHLSSIRPGSTF